MLNADNILTITDFLTDEQSMIDQMCDVWAEEIAPPTPQVRRMIAAHYKQLDDFSIRYAIDETAIAPTPSLRYFLAICRRLESEKADREGGSTNV